MPSALFVFGLSASLAFAQSAKPVDSASQQGVQQTQDLLRDPNKRNEATKNDPKAQDAMKRVDSITGGGQNSQRAYEISADILQTLVQQTGGDPEKLQQLIQKAQSDPQGFYNSLTPEQRAAIKDLSLKVNPQQQTTNPPGRN